jgi:hypothetical protein
MARYTDEHAGSAVEGAAHRDYRREANRRKAEQADLATDPQGLVEFACECTRSDCERSVRVPLYVYRRLREAESQHLLQAGHHAFEHYRTIVSLGLVRIEEKAS